MADHFRLDWNGEAAKAKAKALAYQALVRICLAVTRQAKLLLSVPGTGRIKGQKAGPVTHSAPGEPPFKQTGRLRASVTYEIDEATATARVGTNLDYGRHLELGTKKGLKARPWLRRSVAECKALIASILGSLKGF